jgi:hypothetical protein
MADEISVSYTFNVNNNNLTYFSTEGYSADQSLAGGPSNGVQAIGTSHEAIGITDITNLGYAKFKNLDQTNFVEVGIDVAATFYPFIKLLPGETCVVRLSPAITLYAQANTLEVKLESMVFEA